MSDFDELFHAICDGCGERQEKLDMYMVIEPWKATGSHPMTNGTREHRHYCVTCMPVRPDVMVVDVREREEAKV